MNTTIDPRPDIPLGTTRDANGNELTYRDTKGNWRESTYHDNGKLLTHRLFTAGLLSEYTYDEKGNELTYKDSEGGSWSASSDQQEAAAGPTPSAHAALNEVLSLVNRDKDGDFFICAEGESVIERAQAIAARPPVEIALLNALRLMRERYSKLHDALSDCMESGRLTRDQLPDNYDALVVLLSRASEAVEQADDALALALAQELCDPAENDAPPTDDCAAPR